MAELLGFDAGEIEPSRTYEPIPAGRYVAVITESEMMPTKSGTGRYLQLAFQIIEGEHENRTLWSRLNIENSNRVAVEIALGELSAICHAVGVLQPKDSCELHNLPLMITVKCKRRDDTGEITNEIRGYAKKEAAAPPPNRTPPAATSPPWKRS